MRAVDDDTTLLIPVHGARLHSDLAVPAGARGLVLFAHGSGSSRRSTRNRAVAQALRSRGLGTLLFDLLTADEERIDALDAHLRFDIDMLGQRLGEVTDWVHNQPRMRELCLGYFGASTGAAAALVAAADRPTIIKAVVSRGGRPDLADAALARVHAPTLLIVGSRDEPVIELNQQAYRRLRGPKELTIVLGATHLFEEPGTLEQVARLAGDWFVRYLAEVHARAPSSVG